MPLWWYMTPIACRHCTKEFLPVPRNKKYCSRDCSEAFWSQHLGRRVTGIKLPTATVGAISELAISAVLMKAGYAVFRALSPSCFCDLIATKGGTTLLIEARTGYKDDLEGRLHFPKRITLPANCFAIYERNTAEVFFLNPDLTALEL